MTIHAFRKPYPARDLAVQAAANLVRQACAHAGEYATARRIVFTTDWTPVGHGRAFTWMKPTGSSGWHLVEPRGLLLFPIYRHDRLGD